MVWCHSHEEMNGVVCSCHRLIKSFTWSSGAADDDFGDNARFLFLWSLMPSYNINTPNATTVMHAQTGTSIAGNVPERAIWWETHKLKPTLGLKTCFFWTADALRLVMAGQIQKNMNARRDFPRRLLMFFRDFCPGSLYRYTLKSCLFGIHNMRKANRHQQLTHSFWWTHILNRCWSLTWRTWLGGFNWGWCCAGGVLDAQVFTHFPTSIGHRENFTKHVDYYVIQIP